MSNAVNTLIICGNPGCGKTSISKHTLKNYLHDFYFLDKDTFYVKISGEFMEYVHQNRYDRDSPLYKKFCRNHEYEGLMDAARENAELGKKTLLCAPYGSEFSSLENFLKFKETLESFSKPCFIWLDTESEQVRKNILHRAHAFDKYKLDNWEEYISGRNKSLNPALTPYVKIVHNDSTIDRASQKVYDIVKQMSQ